MGAVGVIVVLIIIAALYDYYKNKDKSVLAKLKADLDRSMS